MSTKQLVYRNYIHYSPKMKTTQMTINRRMDKQLWHVHSRQYYSTTGRNKLPTHATTGMNLNYVMLTERSQSQKSTFFVILFM